ncbi:MAG TPA: hypothetical protein VLG69_01630 [Candidatus Andersenbacteria bacterium]|nr:hypothetical protein [Candidatus Andersenbacteria bacterium]
MTQIMTPSADRKLMTDGQIDKAVEAYRAMLRKHRNELGAEATQQVLGSDNYLNEQVGVFRRHIEAVSNFIVRHVKVDRSRTPQQAIKATGRVLYLNDSVVETMPKEEGEEADVCFFEPEPSEYTRPGFINDDDLQKALERRGLVHDPIAVAAANEEDPAFADKHPNGTQWKDANGKWCYATFRRWRDERRVDVFRGGNGWGDGWLFAGVRKSPLQSEPLV